MVDKRRGEGQGQEQAVKKWISEAHFFIDWHSVLLMLFPRLGTLTPKTKP